MTQSTQPAVAQAPEWVTAEMPPGYQTRLFELQRLSAELEAMDRIARVLWETGDLLKDAVAAVFGALKCEVDVTPGAATPRGRRQSVPPPSSPRRSTCSSGWASLL